MGKLTTELEAIGEKLRASLTRKYEAREEALRLSREAIFKCSTSIRAVHRGEYDTAESLVNSAKALLEELNRAISDESDLSSVGFVQDAQKEYAEAVITLALISGKSIPDPDELGISYVAYLNGLGEVIGELRRHMLDNLRKGEVRRGEEILEMMDEIYGLLVTMDFPEAMTGGLRRTTDMARGVLEKSRGDLTMALCQKELERKLEAFQGKI